MPMAFKFTTIAAASRAHARFTEPKERAPLGADERKARKETAEAKQAEIDSALSKWSSDTLALANELAERYKQKPKYFLEMMFQGGAKMVHHQENVNPYNAFKAEKAAECRERMHGIFLLKMASADIFL